MAAIVLAAVSSAAQTAIETPKILDNVYVGVHAGIASPLDFDHATPFNALAGIKVGKDFTPVFGANAEGTAWFGDNHFGDSKTFLKATYVGVNGTVNFTNLLLGYDAAKTFAISTEAGLGWIHGWNDVDEGETNALGAKTGLVFSWGLGKSKAWQLYAEPAVYWNLTDDGKVKFDNNDAQLAVEVGAVYKFKTSNGTHNFKVWNVGELNDEINKLRAENAKLKDEAETERYVEKIIADTVVLDKTYIVAFANDDASLSSAAKAVLDQVNPAAEVTVDGYADGVGGAKHNAALSKKRADAVAEYLKARGVEVGSADGHGKTGKYAARIAIVTEK